MKSIPSTTSRSGVFLLSLGLFFFSQTAAAENCEPQAGNEYEKIFCQLKRSGRGVGLPNIYQFRENPPITQALLLKKPAERAGIVVKIPERNDQETLRRQEDLLMAAPGSQSEGPRPLTKSVQTVEIIQQAPLPVVQPAKVQAVVAEVVDQKVVAVAPVAVTTEVVADVVALTEPDKSQPAESGLDTCVLKQLAFECTDGRYPLIGNKTNQQLLADALSEDHKLALPVYSGARDDAAALDAYLASAYSRYLSGMMEIGLGASTMSYGKFVNLHSYIIEQKLDFVGRFETMYEYLKKDKQTIGVSTKLNVAAGLTTQSCSTLDNIIVCDYQKTNYIFVKAD